MYAVVTWRVAEGPDADAVRSAAERCLGDRESCHLFGDVRIARVESGTDFLRLTVCLDAIGTTNPGRFTWSAHLLRKNAATRTNADVDQPCVDEVVGG